jgi:two-component system NtrC family sensor kinase
MRWYRSIGSKILLSVAITAIVVKGFFAFISLRIQEEQLNDTILRSASQLSETIKKSIRFDMLENRKEKAYIIMKTIGEQEGIEKVRIYSSEGRVLFSTDNNEVGNMVNKKTEACYVCHSEEKPIEKLTTTERGRIFNSNKGYRVIGMINPIYNEPECFSADCHAHPPAQKVLGVIDVTMSLAETDRGVKTARNQVIFFTLGAIIAISLIIIIFFNRFIGRPVRELVKGTRKVGEGDLNYSISVSSDDEMGYLARSFNNMTLSLKKANKEIQELIVNLEKKVDERTSELKQAQFQLLQAEKLAAIGKIAATVAHEINNPLSGVFTYIKLMERKIENGNVEKEISKFKEYLSTMSREVERTSTIVRNLLDFSRPKEPSRKLTNLTKLIDETLILITNQIKVNNIIVEKRFSSIPDVMADPSQMKQVFLNIMVNACEAMENGGVLTITTEYRQENETVLLDFSDTGVGISPEDIPKIFDPFFTTKQKGTGLGLSVVEGIVTRHGGWLEVKSEVGKGTHILITLPVNCKTED